jgi:hypothetical protein
MEATELVHCVQPSAQENARQKILGQCEPSVGVLHLAGMPYLADAVIAVTVFQFLEWREGFLIPIFCSYVTLPSLIHKMLLRH